MSVQIAERGRLGVFLLSLLGICAGLMIGGAAEAVQEAKHIDGYEGVTYTQGVVIAAILGSVGITWAIGKVFWKLVMTIDTLRSEVQDLKEDFSRVNKELKKLRGEAKDSEEN